MIGQLPDVSVHALDEHHCCSGVVQSNVVRDLVKVAKGGFRPYYFSHRDRRCFA